MDTRRLPEPTDRASEPMALVVENEVEILELSALAQPRRVPLSRAAFVVLIAILAVLVALADMPSRSTFVFDEPLPNFFSTTQAQ
jgi:hypothetical protein